MPSLFDTPFKPMTADDDGFNVDLAPVLVFDRAIVLGKNSKFYVFYIQFRIRIDLNRTNLSR